MRKGRAYGTIGLLTHYSISRLRGYATGRCCSGAQGERHPMLERKLKEKVIAKFKTHESDTGSTPVQVAILTEEIKQLTKHLKDHKKDFSSRRGLLRKVSERRKLLNYLQREDAAAYDKLVAALKLKVVRAEETPATLLAAEEAAAEGTEAVAVAKPEVTAAA